MKISNAVAVLVSTVIVGSMMEPVSAQKKRACCLTNGKCKKKKRAKCDKKKGIYFANENECADVTCPTRETVNKSTKAPTIASTKSSTKAPSSKKSTKAPTVKSTITKAPSSSKLSTRDPSSSNKKSTKAPSSKESTKAPTVKSTKAPSSSIKSTKAPSTSSL